MLGLYLHVPFCASKCPYCDFYSLAGTSDDIKEAYTSAVIRTLHTYADRLQASADTIYFGGGTPTLLGADRLSRILTAARKTFLVPDTAEITLEANPGDELDSVLAAFAAAGGNRLSLGMQAANDTQLKLLGRRHTIAQVEQAVVSARRAGIANLSLDVMLGTPHQTAADVRKAADLCRSLGATHVSAYLLKLEPGTPFATSPPTALPNEDTAADLYLAAVDALCENGYAQYEISNFSKSGFESRHNSKYWNLDPYLGIGPSAHSFLNGKRWYYPRSLNDFINGASLLPENPTDDTIPENSPAEYAMLRLRLTEGLCEDAFYARFGTAIPTNWRERAAALPAHLVTADANGIRLSSEGFLVSDAIIARIV